MTESRIPGLVNQLTGLFKEILSEIHLEAENVRDSLKLEQNRIDEEWKKLRAEREQLDQEKQVFQSDLVREQTRIQTLLASSGAGVRSHSVNDSHHTARSSSVPPQARARSPAIPRRPPSASTKTVEAHAYVHPKSFARDPPRKFALQLEGPLYITCWNGLEKHGQPARVLLHSVRTMEQLAAQAANALRIKPAPTHVVTPDGRPVTQLSGIVPGTDYVVLQSGCSYREEYLPTELLRKLAAADEKGSVAAPAPRILAWGDTMAN